MKNELGKLKQSDELSNFLLYTTPKGDVKVEIYFQNETVWLSQQKMANLFGVQRPAITKHLKNIFDNGELSEELVCSILELPTLHGAIEGKTQLSKTKYYNLDAIISVGYRVNSRKATQFRIWATKVLKEFIIKGFAMDDNRLKNGQYFGKDYFEELLERVRSIRTSERRIYQKITDLFQECSIDYDINSDIKKDFFATVQNKFHFAITGKTAAEIIYQKSNRNDPFMGLNTWENAPKGHILKSDVTIAKNYLKEKEIKQLERAVIGYFDYIENLIERRTYFTMSQLSESVSKFLDFHEYEILEGFGRISKKEADIKAKQEYEIFNKIQKKESDFDIEIKKIIKKKDKP